MNEPADTGNSLKLCACERGVWQGKVGTVEGGRAFRLALTGISVAGGYLHTNDKKWGFGECRLALASGSPQEGDLVGRQMSLCAHSCHLIARPFPRTGHGLSTKQVGHFISWNFPRNL